MGWGTAGQQRFMHRGALEGLAGAALLPPLLSQGLGRKLRSRQRETGCGSSRHPLIRRAPVSSVASPWCQRFAFAAALAVVTMPFRSALALLAGIAGADAPGSSACPPPGPFFAAFAAGAAAGDAAGRFAPGFAAPCVAQYHLTKVSCVGQGDGEGPATSCHGCACALFRFCSAHEQPRRGPFLLASVTGVSMAAHAARAASSCAVSAAAAAAACTAERAWGVSDPTGQGQAAAASRWAARPSSLSAHRLAPAAAAGLGRGHLLLVVVVLLVLNNVEVLIVVVRARGGLPPPLSLALGRALLPLGRGLAPG